MNKTQAINLAHELANEAEEAGLDLTYFIRESANHPDQYAVLERDADFNPATLWVTSELSFPL